MKVYKIGRDSNCQIQFTDSQISRNHALIRVHATGKMEIIDNSSNGTYVNGIRVTSNKPFPITRKDTIVFARTAQLDWSEIPNPLKIFYYVAAGVLAIIIILVLCFSVPSMLDGFAGNSPYIENAGGGTSGTKGDKSSPSNDDSMQSLPQQGDNNAPDSGAATGDSQEGKRWNEKLIEDHNKSVAKKKSKNTGNNHTSQNGNDSDESIIY